MSREWSVPKVSYFRINLSAAKASFNISIGNAAYLAVAIDSDLGIIDPYRASDNFLKKLTLSKNGNKVETFDMMWAKDEVFVFWSNKQENQIYSTSIPQNLHKFESTFKNLDNDSGMPLVIS